MSTCILVSNILYNDDIDRVSKFQEYAKNPSILISLNPATVFLLLFLPSFLMLSMKTTQ